MSAQQYEDPFWIVVGIAVLLLMTAAGAVVLWKISPLFRALCLIAYMGVKILSAILVLDFDALKTLLQTLKEVSSIVVHYGPSSIDYGMLWRYVREVEPSPLRIAVFALIPLGGLVALEVRKARLKISEKGLIEEWRKKTLADVCREWKLKPEAFKKDPVVVAKTFKNVREKRNIPPNIIARKIEDAKVREAILRFARLVDKGEVLEPISDPEEIRRRTIESLKETAK